MIPKAKKDPTVFEEHGHRRIDPYYWLKDRENPEVISYLEAENAYKDQVLSNTKGLQDQLFEEMKGRIKKDDASVPYLLKPYWYYSRYETGNEYPIYARKHKSLDADEEIILDVNKLAKGHAYCRVGGSKMSTDHNLIAYGIDTVGRRIYTIRIKNLLNGETLEDCIEGSTGNLVWANDNQTIFYSKQDPQTLRSYQIYRHTIGTTQAEDTLVYEEKDETFACYVSKTKSKKFIFISSASTLSSESRFIEADQPHTVFKVFTPRTSIHEYAVDHYKDHFYIISNEQAQNFRLMRTALDKTSLENWEELIPHNPEVLLESIEVFNDFYVLEERKNGLSQIRIIDWESREGSYIDFHDPAYMADLGYNPEMDTLWVRYNYESLTTPVSVYEIHMESKETKLLKQKEVLGGFDRDNYQSERIFATAEDGTQVPISLVYKKDARGQEPTPLLLYGYGAYGISMDPYFSSARLSLLDRGFTYAIAHIRGGSEMGRYWYDTGKMKYKKNTFTDFISCAEHLLENAYTTKEQLFCAGGSAGGMLIGAVINMRGDLFKGAVASVPFVDVVTTMLDEDIPLTTGEYDEWGNPNEEEAYAYILSYSPYDNIEPKAYPNLLVMSGLHDSQVQYWEPTKWVAKLRDQKTDTNQLLLHTNMEAGHSGASGRFESLKEVALEYAFLLNLLTF